MGRRELAKTPSSVYHCLPSGRGLQRPRKRLIPTSKFCLIRCAYKKKRTGSSLKRPPIKKVILINYFWNCYDIIFK